MTADRADEGRRILREALARTDECLAMERFEALDAAGSAHVASCAHCQAELALWRSFHDGTAAADEAGAADWIAAKLRRRGSKKVVAMPTARAQRKGGWLPGLAAAAAVLLGVGYLIQPREPSVHEPPADSAYRSVQIRLLSPKGDFREAPASLEWEAVHPAIRYDVEVLGVDQEVLWRTSATQTRVTLPESLRKQLVPGKTVLWRVTGHDAGGRAVAASSVEQFRVAVP